MSLHHHETGVRARPRRGDITRPQSSPPPGSPSDTARSSPPSSRSGLEVGAAKPAVASSRDDAVPDPIVSRGYDALRRWQVARAWQALAASVDHVDPEIEEAFTAVIGSVRQENLDRSQDRPSA